MPNQIRGLNYYRVTLKTETAPPTVDDGGLAHDLEAGGIQNLFVLAHGWNATLQYAESLYQDMFGRLAGQLGTHLGTSAAVGVFWPAAVFPEDDPATPQGAAGTPPTGTELADTLAIIFPHPDQQADLKRLGYLLDKQPHDPARLSEFYSIMARLVNGQLGADDDSGQPITGGFDPVAVFGLYPAANRQPPAPHELHGLPDPFVTLWHWAREVLRILSYYVIKARAGDLGEHLLGSFIANLPTGVRVHLMGHSFGARLVSFALRPQAPGSDSRVKSLLLIQGAFSHFAFAKPSPIDTEHDGGLADCRDRVDGPFLATFSAADRALSWWYPLATSLAHHDTPLGAERTYQWGAVGHDGYQQAGAIEQPLLDRGSRYTFGNDQFYRLNANAVIADIKKHPLFGAHSDICHDQILWAAINAAGLQTAQP